MIELFGFLLVAVRESFRRETRLPGTPMEIRLSGTSLILPQLMLSVPHFIHLCIGFQSEFDLNLKIIRAQKMAEIS